MNLVRRSVPSVSEPEPKAKGELRRTDVQWIDARLPMGIIGERAA